MKRTFRDSALSVLLIMAVAMAVTSCGGSRGAAGQAGPSGTAVTSGGDGGKSLQGSYFALTQGYATSWTDVKVPVSVSLRQPRKFNVSGRLTMVRGKGLSLSVRALGFEVANVTVIGDSVFMTEKLGKRYLAESVSEILAGFPATVDNVQSLLMGRAFILGQPQLSPSLRKGYRLAGDKSQWTLTPDNSPKGVSYVFTVDGSATPFVSRLTVDALGRQVLVDYSSLVTTLAGRVLENMDVSATLGGKPIEVAIEADYSKGEWNKGAKLSRPSTRGYTRVRGRDMVNIVSNLSF